jgi:phage shock protein PspC (stress-responsive transcriptional regulator)
MTENMDFKDRKLYRSQENRMIGGVCGGVAEYFQIDPTLIRLIWIATVLFGGIGIIIYIASLIIIPVNPVQTPSDRSENLIKDKSLFWGSLLIIVGIFLLFRQFGLFYAFNFWNIPWQSVWAIILIIIGALLLFTRAKKDSDEVSAESGKKKLYRSKSQKMIAGVCGGLAEFFEFDVSIIRVLWILGTITSIGIGIIAYIVLMFVFPEEQDNVTDKNMPASKIKN